MTEPSEVTDWTVVAQIRRALEELNRQPHGAARIAAAERLVGRAAETGDRPLLIEALLEQITAYNFGGESQRMLVPFARALKMWDDRPEDFGSYPRYRLFWQFKWASTGMIWHPDVPLSTIRHWLDEMERRYRIAGHGLQPVYSHRHHLAVHLGDDEAAARYFDEWTAAERTQMSDCQACELNAQGDWQEFTGDDAGAMRTWAPVVRGEHTCLEEPHLVLAKSLLPLVRLGRLDEARANHLRGYRMVRANPNMPSAIGQHIEFAALTGNEARGLEMLIEHVGWLAPGSVEDAENRLGFYVAAAVLLRRLCDLGQESLELPVPPGGATTVAALRPVVEREIADIGRRFDARNGTTAVSDRSRRRLAAKPLVASLPLGVRTAPIVPSAPPPSTVGGEGAGLDALIAEATRMTAAHDPRAASAWERVAASGAQSELSPLVQARIAESRAVEAARSDQPRAVERFLDVADLFAAAGDPARAIVNRARAGLAAATSRHDAPAGADPFVAFEELVALRSGGRAVEDRLLWTARLCAVRTRLTRWMVAGAGAGQERAELDRELAAMIADAERAGAGYELAEALLSVAQVRLAAGDVDAASEPLDRAIEAYLEAGAPAQAADALLIRARSAHGREDYNGAHGHLLRARQAGDQLLDDDSRAEIASLLADVYLRREEHDLAAAEALTAAHLYDGIDPVTAIGARRQAAFAFERARRPAEAAALLESLLPDLERRGFAEEIAPVKHLYGRCLQALGEHRDAAKVFIATTSLVRDWPDQMPHASLTHDAGNALESAGLSADAEAAYRRAAQLWQAAADPEAAVRAIRAAAWTLVHRADPDWRAARELFEEAATMSDAERPETLYQAVEMFQQGPVEEFPDGYAHRVVAMADEAAAGFDKSGELGRAIRAELLAADTVGRELDDPAAALARIARARGRAVAAGATRLVEWCDDDAGQWKR